MGHFGQRDPGGHSTPKEWLEHGAQISTLVSRWSGRGDLVAELGPKAGRGVAPALFDPRQAVIELNTDQAFGEGVKPKTLPDFTDRRSQFEWPRAMGLTLHESMHSAHSLWDLEAAHEALKPNEYDALMMLEETRIEGYGVRTWPRNRSFVRSSAMDLIVADVTERAGTAEVPQSDTRTAAHLAGLSLARVDAGVLDESDIVAVRAEVDKFIKPDVLAELGSLWREFQAISDSVLKTAPQRAYDIAIRWNELVHEQAEENGEQDDKDGNSQMTIVLGMPGAGSPGAGEPSEGGELSDAQKAMIEAMLEDMAATAIDAQSEAGEQEREERWEEQNAKAAALAKEQNEHKNEAAKVFAQGSQPLDAKTDSYLVKKRPPTGPERAAAITIGKLLENAKYHDRIKTVSRSTTPPGRLNMRQIVQSEAYKAQGMRTPVEPFKHVQRKHVEDPNLTIGMMVDISGSMNGAMEPMSVAAWAMSEAAHRIQAKIAMTYYGNDVFATLRPGQRLDQVHIYAANDGTEKFNRAFMATDGVLQLLEGEGARLLVIASDGQYSGGEPAAVEKWLARCQKAGVGVLWLGFGHSRFAADLCKKFDAVFLPQTGNVTDAAKAIGQAGADALTRASDRMNIG